MLNRILRTSDEALSSAAPATNEKKELKLVSIASLDDLDKFIGSTFLVSVEWQGSAMQFEAAKLTPAQETVIGDVINSVMPPQVSGPNGIPTFNYNDVAYLRAKSSVVNTGRALAVYWSVKAFNQKKPDLKEHKSICDFVQSQATDSILERLWLGIQNAHKGKTAETVNF